MVNEVERGVTTVQTYPFEVTVNDPEFVEVVCTRHDPTQLRDIVRNATEFAGKQRVGSPAVNDSHLD